MVMKKKVIVFVDESNMCDPKVFHSVATMKQWYHDEDFDWDAETDKMFNRLEMGEDWADHCCWVGWREIQ
jgi:hypothetical protein